MLRRVIASSAPNGSSRHSTGLPASSVRRNATRWRMPAATARAAARASKPPGRSARTAARALARAPRARRRRLTRSAQRGVVERARPRAAARSRWGMSTAGARSHVPASGVCSPQTSSSSVDLPQPLGPTTATTSPGAARQRHVRRARATRAEDLADALQEDARPRPSPCACAPSAGITPQVRRVSAGTWRYLSRAYLPAPLVCLGSTVPARDFARTASIAQAGRRPPRLPPPRRSRARAGGRSG